MTDTIKAWLMEVSDSQRIAVSENQMHEFVVLPKLSEVPLAPHYCHSLLSWQGHYIPVMDMAVLAGDTVEKPPVGVAVVAFRNQSLKGIQYAGFTVYNSPARILVGEQQTIDIPEQYDTILRNSVISSFLHEDQQVYIHDIAYLYSRKFCELGLAA